MLVNNISIIFECREKPNAGAEHIFYLKRKWHLVVPFYTYFADVHTLDEIKLLYEGVIMIST